MIQFSFILKRVRLKGKDLFIFIYIYSDPREGLFGGRNEIGGAEVVVGLRTLE